MPEESGLKQFIRQNTLQEPSTDTKVPLKSNDPAAEIKRFEDAARASEAESNPYFWLDNVLYDAEYVKSFCETLNNSGTEKDKFIYEVLKASSRKGEKGECFGKKFPNAEDCFNVMRQIRDLRRIYSTVLTSARDADDSDLDKFIMKAWASRDNKIKLNGRKYDVSLKGMPPETQFECTKILDEELFQDVDLDTKRFLHSHMPKDPQLFSWKPKEEQKDVKSPEYISRLYRLMELSGNPGIRKTEDSMIESVVGENRAHFIPDLDMVGGTCYANNIDHYISELAHAFRNKNNFFGETLQFTRDGLSDIFSFNNWGFTTKAVDKNYKDPEKMEHDTHEIVEPELNRYLDGKTPTVEQMYARIDMQRKTTGNTYSPTISAGKMIEEGYKQIKAEETEKAKREALVGALLPGGR